MIVLDATALVALARDEPSAAEVEGIIRGGRAAISAVNVAEVADVLVRRHAVPLESLDRLVTGVTIRPGALVDARRAGELRARHYHRSRRPLSLADCFVLACAGVDDEIATSDQGIADTAHDEGVALRPLPNSHGVKPRRRR